MFGVWKDLSDYLSSIEIVPETRPINHSWLRKIWFATTWSLLWHEKVRRDIARRHTTPWTVNGVENSAFKWNILSMCVRLQKLLLTVPFCKSFHTYLTAQKINTPLQLAVFVVVDVIYIQFGRIQDLVPGEVGAKEFHCVFPLSFTGNPPPSQGGGLSTNLCFEAPRIHSNPLFGWRQKLIKGLTVFLDIKDMTSWWPSPHVNVHVPVLWNGVM